MNSIRKKPGRVRRPISAELVDQVLACKASYGSAPNFCACYGISLYIYYRICNENRDRLTILEHERLAKWNVGRADRLLALNRGRTDRICIENPLDTRERERLAKWNARRADRLLKTDPLCQ